MEYLDCNLSEASHEIDVSTKIDALSINKRDNFTYLGSMIQGKREIDKDVTH